MAMRDVASAMTPRLSRHSRRRCRAITRRRRLATGRRHGGRATRRTELGGTLGAALVAGACHAQAVHGMRRLSQFATLRLALVELLNISYYFWAIPPAIHMSADVFDMAVSAGGSRGRSGRAAPATAHRGQVMPPLKMIK